jgi:hypothetical protein
MIKLLKRFALLLSISLFFYFHQAIAAERALLYSSELSGELQTIVHNIQDLQYAKVPYADIPATTNYFVRIAPRKYTLTADNKIASNAILGTKPLVFFATPEGIYGKSLLDIYLDIGYEAEDIIHWQRDTDMVAIVFRYEEEVTFSDVKTGTLPTEWSNKVYIPTWDNVFAVFHQLAQQATVEPNKTGEFAPQQLFFTNQAQKDFVLGFPATGKQFVMSTDYKVLKNLNGSDWAYRDLLEKKLSIFEHFRGNGRTLNELVDPQGVQQEAGLREFIGPNRNLNTLPEIAIIDLGALKIQDSYYQ